MKAEKVKAVRLRNLVTRRGRGNWLGEKTFEAKRKKRHDVKMKNRKEELCRIMRKEREMWRKSADDRQIPDVMSSFMSLVS